MVRKTEGAREKLGRLPERARARGKVNPPDQKLIRDGEDAASEQQRQLFQPGGSAIEGDGDEEGLRGRERA